MADGWNPRDFSTSGRRQIATLDLLKELRVSEPFPDITGDGSNKDYTDAWPTPNVGDDLNLNSGRFPRMDYVTGRLGRQYGSDVDALEGRRNRLELIQSISEDRKKEASLKAAIKGAQVAAVKEVAELSFDAMLESCVNQGQYELMSKFRNEWVAYYGQRALKDRPTFPLYQDFIGFWDHKAEINS